MSQKEGLENIEEVHFDNRTHPASGFDILPLQDLLNRDLDHDIGANHIVRFYVMIFIIEGRGSHFIDFRTYEYEPGTVLLVRQDQMQRFIRNSSVKGFLMVFTEDFIISHLNKLEALKAIRLFNESLSSPRIVIKKQNDFNDFKVLVTHLETEYLNRDEFSIGITRSVLHIVITKLYRIKSRTETIAISDGSMEKFTEFQEEVDLNCFNQRKVFFYSQKLGMSSKTLNNLVSRVTNKSAKAFIDERTLLQLKRLLVSTDHSIKEIAYLSGFSDPANFHKFFKRQETITPEEFRVRHKANFPF